MPGEWIRTADRIPVPSDHPGGSTCKDAWGRVVHVDLIPCVVVLRAHPREVELLLWNLHHLCWDDPNGDDFRCEASAVLYWQPAPAPPAEDPNAG